MRARNARVSKIVTLPNGWQGGKEVKSITSKKAFSFTQIIRSGNRNELVPPHIRLHQYNISKSKVNHFRRDTPND